ncbi:hypothetical protein UA08_05072 [Talaromyces atroroseus]|uniref:C2H2-type domain-containing protein n=1 Tax=Talaromyces atroroseus TaxID=1441469 RepID=A0A225AVK0_TALAT|nr:hypothetical protein UA08_05072 [Talaromyces atroroseus]OKL59629.1 hypothetical protein UA08_05072 [Talaromyces atroroseus]
MSRSSRCSLESRPPSTASSTPTEADLRNTRGYFLFVEEPSNHTVHGWQRAAFMLSDVYDSDDALNRSPGLKPSVIKYGPDESIPPFLQEKQQRALGDGKQQSSTSPTSSESRSPKYRRRRRKPQSSLGDAVLIGFLDPNRPDIARQAGQETLGPDSDESEDDKRNRATLTSSLPVVTRASDFAKNALELIPDVQARNNTSLPSIKELVPQEAIFSTKPPPLQTSLEPLRRPRQDSLADSSVGKYTISSSNKYEILPALQAPTPSAVGSPDNTQSLPSIRSAVFAELESNPSTPFHMLTPQLTRGTSTQSELSISRVSTAPASDSFQIPTPFSHPSPMSLKEMATTSPVSQSQYMMQPPSLTPDTSNMTSYSESSLRQTSIGQSPANNYPTPTEPRLVMDERSDTLVSGTNLFKCPYPGCTAAAFQTQYLLNSHANVHSQDRPHFCPVIGCSRGIGGKGFKRKNEMIRHGLVHDSPGYVCPFCTDQQHKYPRPDNLQRHVRVHHVDKNKDDPELRNVLAQRPKGSGRGRRRRVH